MKKIFYTILTIYLVIVSVNAIRYFIQNWSHNGKQGADQIKIDKTQNEFLRMPFAQGFKPEKYFSDPKVIELCCAMGDRNLRKIDVLVAEGVDVNARGKNNVTPLLWHFLLILPDYASSGRLFAINSPYPEFANYHNSLKFRKLIIKEHIQMIEHLLVYGADPNIKTTGISENGYSGNLDTGVSLSFLAAIQSNLPNGVEGINILPLLMNYNFDPNVVYDTFNATPLHAACNPSTYFSHANHNNHILFKRNYFDYGMNVPIVASPSNVGLLIDVGADIEHRDNSQNTPLIAAAGGENFDIVLMLLEAGADYTAANIDGQNLAYFLYVAKHYNPKIDTEESIDPYYSKVLEFLKDKDYSLENAFEELSDQLKKLPPPPEDGNTRKDYQRPHDPYADEWIKKRKAE